MRVKRLLFVALAAVFVASLASAVCAANWGKVGTSGFTGNLAWGGEYKRIKFNALAADGAGNIYSTAQNTNSGRMTIYKTDGSKLDVNLDAQGFDGAVTKLVRGGDGAIYALQNWLEINWSYNSGKKNRILRIDENGNATEIYHPQMGTANDAPSDANRLGGMTVGGDGNIYWTTNGAGYNKYAFFWRYDVASGVVEQAPINVTNNGWSETHRMFDLEYVGNGMFNIVSSSTSSNWTQSAISWTTNRVGGVSSTPSWRDWITALAYDPINGKLWAGGRGLSNRNVMTRFNGIGANGIATDASVWHALGTDADNGVGWWVSALAVDAGGSAWTGFGVDSATNTMFDTRGHVVRYGLDLSINDEGTPEVGADIVALTFVNNHPYALVQNQTTGQFSLYTTPEPGSLLALGTGLVGLLGLVRRKK